MINDGLTNAITGMGGGDDKAAAVQYTCNRLTEQTLNAAYEAASVGRKVVDIPALDATRNWRAWQGEAEQITRLAAVETRLRLSYKLQAALISARLYGTAAIYASDGKDPREPLSGNIAGLRVLPSNLFAPGEAIEDMKDPRYGEPKHFTIEQVDVHPSRMAVFYGIQRPKGQGSNEFGGMSVLGPVYDALRAFDSGIHSASTMMHEKNVSGVTIENLQDLLAQSGGEQAVQSRLHAMKLGKGLHNMLVLGEGEEYANHDLNLAGVPQTIEAFMQAVGAAADIPLTRLFGISPGGLQSTGESDLRNYYDRIRAMQEIEVTPALAGFDAAIKSEANVGEGVFYNWRPLWQESQSDIYANAVAITTALTSAHEKGLLDTDVANEALVNVLTEIGAVPGLETMNGDAGGGDDALI